MNICSAPSFLREIGSADFLTYLALLLAYIAYTRSVEHNFDSWKSLLLSFRSDLNGQKSWLQTEYFEKTYENKGSFDPRKIIFPLSFESLPEIIRRGIAEFSWISGKFVEHLSLFNERIIAFNSFLDQIKRVVSADPVMTEKLIDKLNGLGINEESVEFNDFKKKIQELKKEDEILYLAENIRRLNRAIHVELIGNKNKEDKLHFLYSEITKELENIINNFEEKKPFFIVYKWLLITLSVPLFLVIETLLK